MHTVGAIRLESRAGLERMIGGGPCVETADKSNVKEESREAVLMRTSIRGLLKGSIFKMLEIYYLEDVRNLCFH